MGDWGLGDVESISILVLSFCVKLSDMNWMFGLVALCYHVYC